MKEIASLSEKRPIIRCTVNGKSANFLVDTGASVGLIDKSKKKEFGLVSGKQYNGSIVGAGGEIDDLYMCNTIVMLEGKPISQFLLADIEVVKDSISRTTGIEILGIIGYKQMQMLGISLEPFKNIIKINGLHQDKI